ncbi:MAG: hypothetical protein JNK40_02175 [Chromatiales bacterium]|nr:hypothetical protein [Chromatiales bacterium]
MRHSVDYLYSLYDALVSIHVPNDKARAVVDAMERDMATTIATKSDLQLLQQATRADLRLLRQETRSDLQQFRQETKADLQQLRQETRADIVQLRQDNALIRKDLEILSTTMTVRLGSMLMLGLGILFAALKLT